MKKTINHISLVIFVIAILFVWSCASENDGGQGTQTAAATTQSSEDRAALLAAQTQLIRAENAQSTYFSKNNLYAATLDDLRSVDNRLSSRVYVTSADASGYEMTVSAADSKRTTLIVRSRGGKVERVDGEGDSW